jgi:hypothetical protein
MIEDDPHKTYVEPEDFSNGSWRAWRKFVLEKLENLERGQRDMQQVLSESLKDSSKKFLTQAEFCRKNQENCNSKYATQRFVYWVLGIMVFVMISLGVQTAYLRSDFGILQTRQEILHKMETQKLN